MVAASLYWQYSLVTTSDFCAEILEQSRGVGAKEPRRSRVVVPGRQAT